MHGYSHKQITALTELKDGDHIRVVLRNPLEIIQPRSNNYGCQSYSFSVPQTENGIKKFFSILKFIVSTQACRPLLCMHICQNTFQCSPRSYNEEYDFDKFLSYLMTLTEFPPMIYAMQSLKEFSFLTISGWVCMCG